MSCVCSSVAASQAPLPAAFYEVPATPRSAAPSGAKSPAPAAPEQGAAAAAPRSPAASEAKSGQVAFGERPGTATPRSVAGSEPRVGLRLGPKADAACLSPTTLTSASRFGFTTTADSPGYASTGANSPSAAGSPQHQPRGRVGVVVFTDPRNPFQRQISKRMVGAVMEEMKYDASRAGARTKNPGILPAAGCADTQNAKDVKGRLVVFRYGNEDWRPGKAAAGGTKGSARGMNSEGVGEAVGATSVSNFRGWAPASQQSGVLANYLNDMKRTGLTKRRLSQDPSEGLQRMNERKSKLPQDRQSRLPSRAMSCDLLSGKFSEPPSPMVSPRATYRRTANDESDRRKSGEVDYGFGRRRPVQGDWCHRSSPTMLHHHQERRTQSATPRGERHQEADRRFGEVVAHMKTSGSVMAESKSIREKSENTFQMLYSKA